MKSTLNVFWRGLLTGNLRHFRKAHYQMWDDFIGHRKYYSIEIEYTGDYLGTKAELLSVVDPKFQPSYILTGGQREVTRLFRVGDLRSFMKDFKYAFDSLGSVEISTFGSVHSNYCEKRESLFSRSSFIIDSDFATAAPTDNLPSYLSKEEMSYLHEETYRIEIKRTPSFFIKEDLLVFSVVMSNYLATQKDESSLFTEKTYSLAVDNCKSIANRFYPKVMKELSIFC